MIALGSAPAEARDDYDAFVLAGQSNLVGGSRQNEDSFEGRVTSPSSAGLASWSFRQADHRWTLANEFPCADEQCSGTNCSYPGPNRSTDTHPRRTDVGTGTCVCTCGVHIPASNANADAARGSAWPTFADEWMRVRGRELRFVAAGLGGSCLTGAPNAIQPAWDPDAMDCSTLTPVPLGASVPSLSTPGELYCRMLESVSLAQVGEIRAVLWMQGECDATASVPYDVYRAALERFADAVWRDLGAPLIVAPISRHTWDGDTCLAHPKIDAIAAATVDAASANAHILLGPNSDDLELEPDCTHIHDVVTFGERWFDAVSAVLPQCRDGIDNDGDGLFDASEDVGCAGPMGLREDPPCQDGIDNDGDGRIDFDGGAAANGGTPLAEIDPECDTPGATERPAACGVGAELVVVLGLFARRRLALV